MDKIINEIIQAEHNAQQITKDALLLKKNMQDDIKNEIDTLREKRFLEAKILIEKSNSENQILAEKEVFKTREMYMQKIDEIQKSYDNNHKQWALIIYNKLIGR